MVAVVQEILFPLMCHSDEDQDLWESDPVEYIRVKYGEFFVYVYDFIEKKRTSG